MKTDDRLIEATQSFFVQYWNPINGLPPKWSCHWKFINSIPNNEKRGCYALFCGNELMYIGIGIGNSFDKYYGSGLGDRLKRYWKFDKVYKNDRIYKPRNGWEEITSIMTIGFDEKHFYIAAALEIYLIRNLCPKKNIKLK